MNDAIENEAKILNIGPEEIRGKLIRLGAQKVGEFNFRRHVFDAIPKREGRWLRLRTDGQRTTITAKEISHDDVDGTSEWEVEVSDFEDTLKILQKIGLESRGYQENRRELYKLNDVEISIDFWPRLKPYIEIEAKTPEQVYETARQLGFNAGQLTGKNTKKLYAESGIDLDKVAELNFDGL
ncbi:CYTH domain-containing protein [Candidatus Saccharibacteria bacterium]|nr:CYTH domain-containing protein [Candidatus Saccharibacteria bacterium]